MTIQEQIDNVEKNYRIVTNGLHYKVQHYRWTLWGFKKKWCDYSWDGFEFVDLKDAQTFIDYRIEYDKAKIRGWSVVENKG